MRLLYDNPELTRALHEAYAGNHKGMLAALADQMERWKLFVELAESILGWTVSIAEIARICEHSAVRLGISSVEPSSQEMDDLIAALDASLQRIGAEPASS